MPKLGPWEPSTAVAECAACGWRGDFGALIPQPPLLPACPCCMRNAYLGTDGGEMPLATPEQMSAIRETIATWKKRTGDAIAFTFNFADGHTQQAEVHAVAMSVLGSPATYAAAVKPWSCGACGSTFAVPDVVEGERRCPYCLATMWLRDPSASAPAPVDADPRRAIVALLAADRGPFAEARRAAVVSCFETIDGCAQECGAIDVPRIFAACKAYERLRGASAVPARAAAEYAENSTWTDELAAYERARRVCR